MKRRRQRVRWMSLCLLGAGLGALVLVGCERSGSFDHTPGRISLDAEPAHLEGDWCGDLFLVTATINGRGPLTLLLDTGASVTVLDDDTARLMPDSLRATNRHTRGGGGGRVAYLAALHVDSLTSGGVALYDFDAAVLDLEQFTPILGRLDGVLGYSALQGSTFAIDYAERSVQVSGKRLDPDAPRGEHEAWFQYNNRLRPGVLVEAAGRRFPVLVDTGSSSGFAFKPFDDLPLATEPIVLSASHNIDAVVMKRAARLDGDIQLGPIRFRRPIVASDVKGNKFGTEAMTGRRWTFDTAAQHIRIDAGPPVVDAEPLESLGFVPTLTPIGLEVLHVHEQRPAAAAGLRVGDVIVALNGVPAGEFRCEGISRAIDLADPVLVNVLREGEAVQLELRTFVVIP